MPATYEPIASQTLGSSASSVTFSSISGTFTDLILVADVTPATGLFSFMLRINSDTGSNYSATSLYGDGSGAYSVRRTSSTYLLMSESASTQNGSRSIYQVHLQSYANTNVNKTVLGVASIPGATVERQVGLWRSTAAITSLTINNLWGTAATSAIGSDIGSGSTFALYGIKAA